MLLILNTLLKCKNIKFEIFIISKYFFNCKKFWFQPH